MKHILFDPTCNRKNDQNNDAFPPIVRFLPPSTEQMVQSWFIHKILAEHKRRGLHSSHSVTRWIPGEDTRTLPFSGRPESYLSLTGLVFFFPTPVASWLISRRLTWIQCLPPAGRILLPGHFSKRRQRRRALRRLHQRSPERYEWFDWSANKHTLQCLLPCDLHDKCFLSWGGRGPINNVLINRSRFLFERHCGHIPDLAGSRHEHSWEWDAEPVSVGSLWFRRPGTRCERLNAAVHWEK